MTLDIDTVFRDSKVKNDPHSGEHWPDKPEIRALLKMIQNSGGQAVTRNTLAALNAVTPPNENYMGVVLTGAGAGYYSRSGGAWVFGRPFPDSVARLVSVEGTNVISARVDTGVSPAAVSMYVLTPVVTNTSAVSLNISGGGAKPLLNVNGRALNRGEIQAGSPVLIHDDGAGNYRIVGAPSASVARLQSVAGTPNAITANTDGVDPAAVVLFSLTPTATNTGTVTLALNGTPARPLRAFDGGELDAGFIQTGKPVLLYNNGDGTYRLLVDHRFQTLSDTALGARDEALNQANRAEAEGDRAHDEADRSEAAAVVSSGAMSAVVLAENTFATKTTAEAWSPVAAPDFIRTAGYSSAGDGGGALYKKVSTQPTHAGKFSITLEGGAVVWYEMATSTPSPEMFGATSSDNQSAAFTALEGYATGREIDLLGKTYTVTTIPTGNRYVNGFFTVASRVSSTILGAEILRNPPRFESIGGQLRKLKQELANPFCQYVGIVLIGDSITWGQTLPDNAATDPRDGTLSDPRNTFAPASWANELSRYLGRVYAAGVAPILSNWAASPSGQNTHLYAWDEYLYPGATPFVHTANGALLTRTDVAAGGIEHTNFQMQLADGNSSGTSYHQIDMPNFTGDRFSLFFASVGSSGDLSYEVFVDGNSIGVFSTAPGGGVVVGNNNRRDHTFSYVRNKTVRIRTTRNGNTTTPTMRFRPEAVLIPRRIRFSNQGINGSAARVYKLYNLDGNFGDGVAVSMYDQFIFVQLGTNDRLKHPTAAAWTTTTFHKNYDELITHLKTLGSVVSMCANPTTDQNPTTMSFNMTGVRNVVRQVAYARDVDLIDNFGAFDGLNLTEYLHDGLHPNRRGHAVMARNVIGAIESA